MRCTNCRKEITEANRVAGICISMFIDTFNYCTMCDLCKDQMVFYKNDPAYKFLLMKE